jgi:hypothetical protein
VSPGGASLATNENIKTSTVTLDQEQKKEIVYEVFDEYGDKPIPE